MMRDLRRDRMSVAGEERFFARALAWSASGHLILAAVIAPLVASSTPVSPFPDVLEEVRIVFEPAFVTQAAEAGVRVSAHPGSTTASGAPTDGLLPTMVAPASPAADGLSPHARGEHDLSEVILDEAPPGEARTVPMTANRIVAPVVVAAARPVSADAVPSFADVPAAGVVMPVASAPAANDVRGANDAERAGTATPPAATRAAGPPGVSAAESADVGPRPTATRGAGSGAIPPGIADARPATGEGAGPALAAYRARVAGWLRPRVERRYLGDLEGRSADAPASAIVQLALVVDAEGRARVVELGAPSPALDRIVRDVLRSSVPAPPAELDHPVTLRFRIRFVLS